MPRRPTQQWPPIFPLEPIEGREPARMEEVYDEVFSAVEQAIRQLTRSKASQQVLFDYLPSSRGDVVASALDDALWFAFRSPAGMCNMSAEAAVHWSELCLLALRPQVDELLEKLGYRLGAVPSLEQALARGPRYPMIELGGLPYCVPRRKQGEPVEIFTDQIPDALTHDTLSAAQRRRVDALADGGPCQCALCQRLRRSATSPRAVKQVQTRARAQRTRASASPEATSLGDAVRRRDVVTSLYLGDKHLGEIAPEVGKLHRLEELSLHDNGLTSLPDEIGQLASLRRLNLSDNPLTSLPAAMRALAQLDELDLGCTRLPGLPDWLPALPSLKKLRLSFFPAYPAFARFPEELAAMTHLEELYLQGAARWHAELEDFDWSRMTRLRSLTLQNCALTRFPPALLGCTALGYLSLEGCEIPTLPDDLGRLSRLTSLRLGNNHLAELPATLSELSLLEDLSLGHNPIARLPAGFTSLRQLRSLDLSETKLTALPDDLGRLERLELFYLDRCTLGALPASITQLRALKDLFLRGVKGAEALLAPHRSALPGELKVHAQAW